MKNYKDEMLIVSYGGGTNSTAMLIGLRDKGVIPEAIIFADTGAEKPHTYEYIGIMNDWLEKNGMPGITVVKSESVSLEEDCIKRKALPSVAYGFKTCSHRFKIQPQEKWLNNYENAKEFLKTGKKITKVIGFDADEPQRAVDYDHKKYAQWYPMIDWDWGREECIEVIEKEGLPLPGKSSCYFCPNSKVSEIKELKEKYPELAMRAIEIEERAELKGTRFIG